MISISEFGMKVFREKSNHSKRGFQGCGLAGGSQHLKIDSDIFNLLQLLSRFHRVARNCRLLEGYISICHIKPVFKK